MKIVTCTLLCAILLPISSTKAVPNRIKAASEGPCATPAGSFPGPK